MNQPIERAVILSPGKVLRLEASLPEARETTPEPDPDVRREDGVMTESEMRDFRRNNIIAALKEANWRVSGPGGAAELLDVRPTTLADRIRAFGIERPRRR